MNYDFKNIKVLVRGAGDIASGIIWSLAYAGFNVCCTEVENPSTIRTEVAFSTAIYDRKKTLDGVECILCMDSHSASNAVGASFTSTKKTNVNDIYKYWEENKVVLIVDPGANI